MRAPRTSSTWPTSLSFGTSSRSSRGPKIDNEASWTATTLTPPGLMAAMPSCSSFFKDSLIAPRLVVKRAARSRSEGRRSPGRYWPQRISSRKISQISSARDLLWVSSLDRVISRYRFNVWVSGYIELVMPACSYGKWSYRNGPTKLVRPIW